MIHSEHQPEENKAEDQMTPAISCHLSSSNFSYVYE